MKDVPGMNQPKETQINGKSAAWTDEIWKKWYTAADDADPKYTTRPCISANYFTPRPATDQYNRGSNTEGFTYTLGDFEQGYSVFQVIINKDTRPRQAPPT